MTDPHLAEIWIYPIKSLDGMSVLESSFVPSGGLAYDRQWALFADDGTVINAKGEVRLHTLRSRFAADLSHVTFEFENQKPVLIPLHDKIALSAFFSDVLQQAITVQSNTATGFPDDLDAPGPTLINRATLQAMADWFPGLTAEDMRRRLRPNLVLDQMAAFAEDALVGPAGSKYPFTLGTVRMYGMNVCQRCAVPARDPLTGAVWHHFQATFAQQRERHLPAWAERSQFDHFYRSTVNTQVDTTNRSQRIAVGDVLACGHVPNQ